MTMRAATLVSTVGLLLLLLATIAASGPVEDNYNYGGGLNGEEQLMKDYLLKVEGQHEEEAKEFKGEFSNEHGKQPSESYLQEVRDQEAECHRVINHSDRIALKYGKNQWLECNGNCASSDCPGLVMDRDDWTDCRDETFRIYRMGGRYRSDIIQCGSYVALYQGFTVGSGAWLGCANTRCSIGTCPGLPSIGIGNGIVGIHNKVFQTCWGEVFIIYARGKTLGEPITENDYIMLYYPRDQNYVSLWPNQPYAHHETCPGTARPPGTDKYNDCVGEVLQIIKR